MSDRKFRRDLLKYFRNSVAEDVIKREFRRDVCHLCRVEFNCEESAWSHYRSSDHSSRLRKVPKQIEKATEFWVMIIKALAAFDPDFISREQLIDHILERFDVREYYSKSTIIEKIESNIADMINYFQTVRQNERRLLGLRRRGREYLPKFAEWKRKEEFLENKVAMSKRKNENEQRSAETVVERDSKRIRRNDSGEIDYGKDSKQVESCGPTSVDHSAFIASDLSLKNTSALDQNTDLEKRTPEKELMNNVPVSYLQQLQLQYIQACQQQLSAQVRPILLLPSNANLSPLLSQIQNQIPLSQQQRSSNLQPYPMVAAYQHYLQQQQQQLHSQLPSPQSLLSSPSPSNAEDSAQTRLDQQSKALAQSQSMGLDESVRSRR